MATVNEVGGSAGFGTVLIVDDEVLLRLLVADELRERGFTVVEASNADEALSILQSGTTVHVLFTDVQMPGALNGIDLARVVAHEWPEVELLVTSGHVSGAELDQPATFFPKPYDPREIAARIAALCDVRGPQMGATQVSAA
jgi:two-component system, response regulator PdtaR